MNDLLLYFRGRVALAEILISNGIIEGDRVAIQAYTCSAVPEGVYASKATPLYIDVVKEGVTMSPNDLKAKLDNTKNVKAIVIQHTFGIVANLEKIIEIAKKNDLIIIEDCCHSFNSEYKGQKIGNFSDASFYSFEWGKPIALGLGGLAKVKNSKILYNLKLQYNLLKNPPIFTEIQLFVQRIAFLILYSPKTYWFVKRLYHFFSKLGIIKGNQSDFKTYYKSREFNYKISRVLKHKLEKKINELSHYEEKSQKLVSVYEKNILNLDGVKKIKTLLETKQVYVRYPIWVRDKEKVSNLAEINKVEIASWYASPVHHHVGKDLLNIGYHLGSCPNAEESSRHIVSLPLSHNPSEDYVEKLKKTLS